jgi:hypothetical protein
MHETALGWGERALQAAVSGKLDSQYLAQLEQFLATTTTSDRAAPLSQPHLQPQPRAQASLGTTQSSRPAPSRDIVLFRQESEMTVMVDEERDELAATAVPLKQPHPHNYTTLPLITRTNSDKPPPQALLSTTTTIPSLPPHSNHSSESARDHPTGDGNQTSARSVGGGILSLARGGAEVPAAAQLIDTAETTTAKKARASQSHTHTNLAKGRKSPARKGSRDPGDEISHLTTEEEIAYTPISTNKQRPKSAVSKLGGYDHRSVNSAIPTAEDVRKSSLPEFGREASSSSSSRSGKQRSSPPHAIDPLLPSHSLQKPFAELDFPSSLSAVGSHSPPLYSLESLMTLQETLQRHIGILHRERQQLDHLRHRIKEAAQSDSKAQKRRAISEIKEKRRQKAALLTELEFERSCISHERLGPLLPLLSCSLTSPPSSSLRILRDHSPSTELVPALLRKAPLLSSRPQSLLRGDDRRHQALSQTQQLT